MVRSDLIVSTYGTPARKRLWQFKLNGDARCLVDAPLVASLDAGTLARIDGAATLVRVGVSLAEAYEAAARVPEPSADVPLELPTFDQETGAENGTEPHPAWAAYGAAQAHMAAATPDTVRFVIVRRGEPEDADSAEWAEWRAAQDRFEEAISSILETAPPLTSPDALPTPANLPDFIGG